MEKDGSKADLDGTLDEFLTYEEYLDSKITPLDLYYLEDEKLARQVVELGLRGTGEVLKREEFESRKAAAQASRLSKRSKQKTLASAGKELKDNFLRALAEREEANRSGKNHIFEMIGPSWKKQLPLMKSSVPAPYPPNVTPEINGITDVIDASLSASPRTMSRPLLRKMDEVARESVLCKHTKSIIFIRDHNACGQEISGYIDYAHRLKYEDFEPYFSGKKRLLPQSTDLSFYNWKTNEVFSNDSANYQVITNSSAGILFMSKKDRNSVNVDPQASPCDHSLRMYLKSDIYLHVAIFDHYIKGII